MPDPKVEVPTSSGILLIQNLAITYEAVGTSEAESEKWRCPDLVP